MGAQTPIRSYVGSSPIAAVPPPISSSVTIRIDLRPILSPKWPKTIPPRGRATNPTENVAKTAIVPVRGSSLGKKSLSKTRGPIKP